MQIKNVLIIEDDEVAATLLCYLIEDILHIQAIVAKENGQAGFAYLEQVALEADKFPDLIFIDLNMPHMSGYDFIQQYEKSYASRFPDTQLVVLTSSLRKEDREATLIYPSVAGFFRKPLQEAELAFIKRNAEDR